MAYNTLIDEAHEAAALLQNEYIPEIFDSMPKESVVMRHARKLRDMSQHQSIMRVMDGDVTAYFVGASTVASGEGARIQTSTASWANKTIKAAKLGVIVPITHETLEDSNYDLATQLKPYIAQAFGRAFDAAVLFGTNAPSDWPDDLVTGAASASTVASIAAFPDLYDAVLGTSGAISLIEAKGYMSTGHVAAPTFRSQVRGVRDADGNPIFTTDPQARENYRFDGAPIDFVGQNFFTGVTSGGKAVQCIGGDWSQVVWTFRRALEIKMLDQAALHDSNGTLTMNLAQDDMVALRCTMRIGWQIANPINSVDASTQYPFYVLTA